MKRLIGLFGAALLVAGLTASIGSAASSSPDFIYQVNPIVQQAGTDTFTNPFCSSSRLVCYTPNDIRTAYNYPSGLDGTGQTIVIVDAFGSPTIQQDLATFDAKFGLAPPPGGLKVICPSGCPTFNPNNRPMAEASWAFETSLDVEWAHAMAPGAKLVLDVSPTPFGDAINTVEAKIFSDPAYAGAIVSQSFGEPENLITANSAQVLQGHRNYLAAKENGLTVLASAGDWGATNFGATPNAAFPSSDPNVLAIGGTQGNPYYNALAGAPLPACRTTLLGSPCSVGLAIVQCSTAVNCPTIGYGGEETWNEPVFDAATGGAASLLFGAPSYQGSDGSGSSARTTPDVSYNAAVSGGVIVAVSFPGIAPGFYIVGGTSAGSPQMASVIALANQSRGSDLGFVNDKVYAIAENVTTYAADFHDITVGNNEIVGTPFGYNAGTGYDLATGWGTPNVASLVSALAGS